MTQQIINIGTAPNDGSGDPLRTAMTKVNQNFTDLYYQISNEGGGVNPLDGNVTLTPGPAGSIIVDANTSSNAFRITQVGTGNALLVEDSANPDATPFVITSSGNVGIGMVPTEKLHVSGSIRAIGDVRANVLTSYVEGGPPFIVNSTDQVDNLTAQFAGGLNSGSGNIKLISDLVLISTNGNANVVSIAGNGATITGNLIVSGNTNVANVTATGTISTTQLTSGTSNIRLAHNANIGISVAGTSNVLTVAGSGIAVDGYVIVNSGNVTVPNLIATTLIKASTIVNGSSNIRIADNANVSISAIGTSNVVVVTGTGANVAGYLTVTGNVSVGNLTTTDIITTTITNGISNITVVQDGNVAVTVGGQANILVVTETGANIAGTANITGDLSTGANATITSNLTVGNLSTAGEIVSTLPDGTAPFTITSTTQVANLNVAASGSVINGNSNIQIAANANVTVSSTGNANVLTVAGTGIVVNGSVSTTVPVLKTTNFTVGVNENWIICNGTGVITATLPTPADFPGRAITIKTLAAFDVNSSASNVVPIDAGTAGAFLLSGVEGKWATIVSDGTNWVTMAQG